MFTMRQPQFGKSVSIQISRLSAANTASKFAFYSGSVHPEYCTCGGAQAGLSQALRRAILGLALRLQELILEQE